MLSTQNNSVSYLAPRVFPKILETLRSAKINKGTIWVLPPIESILFTPTDCEYSFQSCSLVNAIERLVGENCNALPVAVLITGLAKNDEKNLHLLRLIASKKRLPVLVCVLNQMHTDQLAANLAGSALNHAGQETAVWESASLVRLMEDNGFRQALECDYKADYVGSKTREDNIFTHPKTLVNHYVKWVSQSMCEDTQALVLIRLFLPGATLKNTFTTDKEKAPFLSIVTRTQGRRIAELREVFLCLTAQTCDDFELLIIGHKVEESNRLEIMNLIEEAPPSLRKKIQFFPVDHGNRSTPLNYGFSMARGQYISILDDDDLVTDDWIETFQTLSQTNYGCILHAFSVGQEWKRGLNEEDLCALSKPQPTYCQPFDHIRQIHMNLCPIMSLAFPAWLYHHSNFRFDETLDTTEDWDFIMRTAFVTGVADSDKVTSIYRLWQNATSSYNLYPHEYWMQNRDRVRMKFAKMPILLPPGSSLKLEEQYLLSHAPAPVSQAPAEPVIVEQPVYIEVDTRAQVEAVLFADDGTGYSNANAFSSVNTETLPRFSWEFTNLHKQGIFSGFLRFDPAEQTGIVVYNLAAVVTGQDGKKFTIPQSGCTSNGYHVQNQIIFLKEDPQIYLPLPAGCIPDKVVISGEISTRLSSETIDAVIGIPLLKRIYRKFRRVIRR